MRLALVACALLSLVAFGTADGKQKKQRLLHGQKIIKKNHVYVQYGSGKRHH